jgi:hypothetical protein
VKIPPDDGVRRTYSLTLTLAAKGSGNLDLDFITLVPMESYVILEGGNLTIAPGVAGYVVADSSDMGAYAVNIVGGSPLSKQIPMNGPGLFLTPDNAMLGDSRLIILTGTGSDGSGMDITARYTLTVSGRKRLWTI